MKAYINGYYCRDEVQLQIVNKESNRKILEALRDAYPLGLDVIELAKRTGLPLNTIYTQRAELYREYYINLLDTGKMSTTASTIIKTRAKRGRQPLHSDDLGEFGKQRIRKKIIIEEAAGIYDIYDGKKPVPLPPGNVLYSESFTDMWSKIVDYEEEDEICITLLRFLEGTYKRLRENQNPEIKEWLPNGDMDLCCSQCGLNHEARDFMRAILLYLVDQLQDHDKFVDFMNDNRFLSQETYDNIKMRLARKHKK